MICSENNHRLFFLFFFFYFFFTCSASPTCPVSVFPSTTYKTPPIYQSTFTPKDHWKLAHLSKPIHLRNTPVSPCLPPRTCFQPPRSRSLPRHERRGMCHLGEPASGTVDALPAVPGKCYSVVTRFPFTNPETLLHCVVVSVCGSVCGSICAPFGFVGLMLTRCDIATWESNALT